MTAGVLSERRRPAAPKATPARRRRNNFFWLLGAAVGLGLVGLGLPRTIAAWAELAAVPAIDALDGGYYPSQAQSAEAIAGLKRAIAWVPSGPRLNLLGRVEFERAKLAAPGPERTALLAEAERTLTEGLLAEPTDGFSWVRLAMVRELRGASGREIASALAQSLDVAPNARALWLWRAPLLLKYGSSFTAEELPAVLNQLRTLWTTVPRTQFALVLMARDNPAILAKALEGDAFAMDQLERLQEEIASNPAFSFRR